MDEKQAQTILIVDDIPENIDALAGVLRKDYQIKAARDGKRALEIAAGETQIDLILLDIMMPGVDGYEVCRQLKAHRVTRKIPVIFVTAMDEVANEKKGFEIGGVDFISKPISAPIVEARVKTHLALYNQNRVLEIKVEEKTELLNKTLEQLENGSLETIYRLTQAAEYRDEDTGEHIQRMSRYTAAIAKQMGANKKFIESVLRAAPMHDVGKIGIPDRILLKPDKLDASEWKLMKEHTTIGGRILSNSKAGFIRLGEVIALSHHEKWDGSGYPLGLQGKEIPLVGQMVAISDVFDALTTRRPYKEPFSIGLACDIILEGKGTHFKPALVDAFFTIKDEILEIKKQFKDSEESHLRRNA